VFERTDSTDRFFVSGQAADDEVVVLGFRWLASYAREHSHSDAALVVPALRSLDSLERIIGTTSKKRLARDRTLEIDGLTVALYTDTRLPFAIEGPILAVWTRDKSLDKLDTTGAAAICAAPWNPDNIVDWLANWNPIDVRTGTAAAGRTTVIDNPVVAKALDYLTAMINVGTGLSHASDRSSAIHMFRMLRDGGERYVPADVRIWAVRHGWAPDDARELEEMAQKILERRPLRADDSGSWKDDALNQIRREVAEGS
jgi:hypothetical protein